MTTTTENTPQGAWARRPGRTAHLDTSGTEDLTTEFSHDSETGVPTLRMNGTAAVRVVMNGRALPMPSDAQMADLVAELEVVADTAEGDSNDDEIEALQSALDLALGMLGMTRGE